MPFGARRWSTDKAQTLIEHALRGAEERFRIDGALKYDPLSIFNGSTTPVGLYARSRWIGLDNDSGWQKDFDKTIAALRKGQLANGSWENSPLLTIHRLFGLHLTVRQPDDNIDKALEWLVFTCDTFSDFQIRSLFGKQLSSSTIESLPFVNGDVADLFKAAVLFLSTIFGKGKEKAIVKIFQEVMDRFASKHSRWPSLVSTQNFLRAFVVHPEYKHSEVILKVVRMFADMQSKSGTWKGRINSYLLINALGHLDMDVAKKQLISSLRGISHKQNSDGSWGRRGREWKTFLIIHAMKRMSAL